MSERLNNRETLFMQDGPLKIKSFEFAKQIVFFYKHLVEGKKEFVMSKQLLRSGTSIGALIRESKNAESPMDFVHKMAVAHKECDETLYWLELIYETNFCTREECEQLSDNANEILRMLKSAILTTKSKFQKK